MKEKEKMFHANLNTNIHAYTSHVTNCLVLYQAIVMRRNLPPTRALTQNKTSALNSNYINEEETM